MRGNLLAPSAAFIFPVPDDVGIYETNIAGLAGVCGIVFLMVSMRRRRSLIFLTLGAAATTLLFMRFSGVSIVAMIASYRAAAIERGGFSRFGLIGTTRLGKLELLAWTLMVAAPLFSLLVPMWKRLQERRWRSVALYLFLSTALPITLYGMATDAEIKRWNVGCCSSGSFRRFLSWTFWRQASPLLYRDGLHCRDSGTYMGVTRIRVLGIGAHQFFEWRGGNVAVVNKFFVDTYASPL